MWSRPEAERSGCILSSRKCEWSRIQPDTWVKYHSGCYVYVTTNNRYNCQQYQHTYYQESSLWYYVLYQVRVYCSSHTLMHNSHAVPPSHIILHTFSLEFVFLSPKKWYLNLFLSGCTSNSSGPRRGSFSCAAASLTGEPLSSSSIRRLKTSVNLFMLLFHASRALEETADVVKGHWNSFKIISKSLHTIKLYYHCTRSASHCTYNKYYDAFSLTKSAY